MTNSKNQLQMVHLHVRITCTEEEYNVVKDTLVEGYVVYGCQETSQKGKNHYHFIFYDVGKVDTVQKRITRLGFKGNQSKSTSKIRDLDASERYISKGDSEGKVPVCVVNTAQKDTQSLHKQFWDQAHLQEVANKQQKKKSTSDKKKAFLDACANVNHLHPKLVYDKIMECCQENDWLPPDDYRMPSYIEYVCMKHDRERNRNFLLSDTILMKKKRVLVKMGFNFEFRETWRPSWNDPNASSKDE